MDAPTGQPGMAEAQQVRVNFTTDSPDLQLPEGRSQLLVPADIKRYGLSRVLNSDSMLDTAAPIPFEFLVDGAFLRTSLGEYLRERGLSFETTVTLQYVRSLVPPVYQASFQHDDWVSDVDVLSASSRAGLWSSSSTSSSSSNIRDRILSASYDGLLRVWDGSGAVVAVSPPASGGGHGASAKAARWLSPSQVASAGLDRTVRVWRYSEADDGLSGVLRPALALYGHTASVDAVDVHAPSGRVLSASADGCVGLWAVSKAAAPAADPALLPGAAVAGTGNAKRRKLAATGGVAESAPQRGPLMLLPQQASHHHGAAATAMPVSGVAFDPADATVAYSASHDRALRTLDLTTGRVEGTVTTAHPLLALCALGGPRRRGLLAAGTSARTVALVDPRVSNISNSGAAASAVVMTLRGHRGPVASLAPGPEDDANSLVSGSYDGTCRVWDLRSTGGAARSSSTSSATIESDSVYVIERESSSSKANGGSRSSRGGPGDVPGVGAKVLAVAWDRGLGIASAGEDRAVQINRGRDLLAPNPGAADGR
ncbi:ribosome biogenesis protein YTM1 [Xylariaceae sp. FL0804]|nr:ribosome biogenesis protein YTM1 [Xylariaceae sp. FL0804]